MIERPSRPGVRGLGLGNYTLTIQGGGAYQNGDAGDADQLALAFLEQLHRHGQHVYTATFLPVFGAPLDVTNP